MDLYLVRHAVAFDPDPDRWPDDGARPLTPEGIEQFRSAARGLGRLVEGVGIVLSSPFLRAWRTAELLEEEAGWPAPVRCDALEAGRSPTEAVEALGLHREAGSVALVGHEPNLGDIASILLAGTAAQVPLEIRKGGVARLRLDDEPGQGSATLRWLLTPKVLRSLER
jgi:phosphohistidine phosphatase